MKQNGLRDRNSPTCTSRQNGYGASLTIVCNDGNIQYGQTLLRPGNCATTNFRHRDSNLGRSGGADKNEVRIVKAGFPSMCAMTALYLISGWAGPAVWHADL